MANIRTGSASGELFGADDLKHVVMDDASINGGNWHIDDLRMAFECNYRGSKMRERRNRHLQNRTVFFNDIVAELVFSGDASMRNLTHLTANKFTVHWGKIPPSLAVSNAEKILKTMCDIPFKPLREIAGITINALESDGEIYLDFFTTVNYLNDADSNYLCNLPTDKRIIYTAGGYTLVDISHMVGDNKKYLHSTEWSQNIGAHCKQCYFSECKNNEAGKNFNVWQ